MFRPLREEELLSSRIQPYPLPETGLLIKKKESSKKNKSTEKRPSEKSGHKKKAKSAKRNKPVDLMLPELVDNDVGNNLLLDTEEKNDSISNPKEVAPETQREKLKTEKHKKSKKDSKEKDSKKKKLSKKGE